MVTGYDLTKPRVPRIPDETSPDIHTISRVNIYHVSLVQLTTRLTGRVIEKILKTKSFVYSETKSEDRSRSETVDHSPTVVVDITGSTTLV